MKTAAKERMSLPGVILVGIVVVLIALSWIAFGWSSLLASAIWVTLERGYVFMFRLPVHTMFRNQSCIILIILIPTYSGIK